MNLKLRRQQLTLKYCYKIKSQPSNPAFNAVTSTNDRRLYNNKNITLSVGIRIRQLMKQNNLNMPNVSPAFSHTLANIETPTWHISTAYYNTELTRLPSNPQVNMNIANTFIKWWARSIAIGDSSSLMVPRVVTVWEQQWWESTSSERWLCQEKHQFSRQKCMR